MAARFFCGSLENTVVAFFFLPVSERANFTQLCMVPKLHIRWRSVWITCDFLRLWSGSPANPQTILICWLPSERPINTSVDRSYLLPSWSKWVQGHASIRSRRRWEQLSAHHPFIFCCCVRVEEFAQVVIGLSLESGGKLWCICHRRKLISSDRARGRKGHPWHAGFV